MIRPARLLLVTLPLLAPPPAHAQGEGLSVARRPPAGARIVIEPDFLASRDGDVPHVETMVATNPKDARNLVGGTITLTSRDGSWGCKAYASHDGGRAWTPSALAEQVAHGGGDPQVAFTPIGTALFGCLAFVKDDTGRTRAALHVSRSEDGGLTWSRASDLGYSYDHPMMAVDQTTGQFAGRAYIGVLYGKDYDIGVFRSADDGRSWTGPVRLHSSTTLGANVFPLVLFSDGALLVPVLDFPINTDPARTISSLTTWTALSSDGGVTFVPLRRVHTTRYRLDPSRPILLLDTPAFAADPGERHRDRLYIVWPDFGAGGDAPPRIRIQHSDDRGRTWSAAKEVDASAPRSASQFNNAIAVNKDGVVGVSWYDTRDAGDSLGWHQYFSASVDGGATFLPPVRVSSEVSRPLGQGNLTVTPAFFGEAHGPQVLAFLSAASRWGSGGDYAGLAADRDGVFHPFWADSRTGTFQAWTARVRVELQAASADARAARAAGTNPAPAPVDVTSRVEIVADPSRYDAATHELELSLRLRNSSSRAIRGPISVSIREFGSGPESRLTKSELAREREQSPDVLNASNGRRGAGASMDYTAALGTSGVLLPGTQSGPVRWKFRVKDPLRIPQAQLTITGVLEPDTR